MQCENCGSQQFIPGQQSDMVQCRDCGTPRPYMEQPGGQEVSPSEMQVRDVPQAGQDGMGSWPDSGGSPLSEGIMEFNQPGWRRDDSYASIYAQVRNGGYNPGDLVEVLDRPDTGIWANQTGTVSKILGPSVYVKLEGQEYPFSGYQLRPSQQKLFDEGTSWNERMTAAYPHEDTRDPEYQWEHCPSCGTNYSHWDEACPGCGTPIQREEEYPEDWERQAGAFGDVPAWEGAEPTPYETPGLSRHCTNCNQAMQFVDEPDLPYYHCSNCGEAELANKNMNNTLADIDALPTAQHPLGPAFGSAEFEITQVVEPGPSTVEVEQAGEANPLILQHDNPEVLNRAKDTLKSGGYGGTSFEPAMETLQEAGGGQARCPCGGDPNCPLCHGGRMIYPTGNEGTDGSQGWAGPADPANAHMTPQNYAQEWEQMADETGLPFVPDNQILRKRPTLRPQGKVGGLLGSLLGMAGNVAGPALDAMGMPEFGIPVSLAGHLLGAANNGGGQSQYTPADDLNTLSHAEEHMDLSSDLGKAFMKALPALAQFAHSPESGAQHPDIAQFTIMFDQAYPGLKDQPGTPEHQREVESIRPKVSAYEIIHLGQGQMPPEEAQYGMPPGRVGPGLGEFNNDQMDIMDDMVRILSTNRNYTPEDAAGIVSLRTGMSPEHIKTLYDQQVVSDWQHVSPQNRPDSYQQLYTPGDYPPNWGEYDQPMQGLSPLSAYDDGFGYDSPNTRRDIVDTGDPHGDGIDAAVHGDNPDAWQRMDDMQGGGSNSSFAPCPDCLPNQPNPECYHCQGTGYTPRYAAALEEIDPNYVEPHPVDTQFPTIPEKMDPAQTPTCPKCQNKLVGGSYCPSCNRSIFQMLTPQVQNPQMQQQDNMMQQQQIMQNAHPYPPPTLGRVTAGVGPHNIQQVQMVFQYLQDNGMAGPGTAEDIINNPDNYADALAAIQQKGTTPDVDPTQPPAPMPPPPVPGGGPPPEMGPPTTMMQASKQAADTAAPNCPQCGGHTTALLDDDGHCKCHSCGHSFQTNMEPGDDRHSYGATNPWVTTDGQALRPGMEVEMVSQASPIPDKIRITDISPTGHYITYTLEGLYGLHHETTITKDEAELDGLYFQTDQQQVNGDVNPPTMEQPPPDINSNSSNEGTTGSPETTNLAIQSSLTHCAHCHSSYDPDPQDIRADLCPTCNFDIAFEGGLSKTAGKDFSHQEKMDLINEPGTARNVHRLQLEGTHYTAADIDDEQFFLW